MERTPGPVCCRCDGLDPHIYAESDAIFVGLYLELEVLILKLGAVDGFSASTVSLKPRILELYEWNPRALTRLPLVKSPPWHMKLGMTLWNLLPLK